MTSKVDEYPNKDDYKPFVDKNMLDEMYELPLSDPAPSHTVNANRTYVPDEAQISAFAENKKSDGRKGSCRSCYNCNSLRSSPCTS